MPINQNINHVLVIGAGPIVIGQACEFDYSGTQACKALREEGCRVTLINSNPATIMTDPDYADSTYIEPIMPNIIEMIIEKERPDSILPTMGGQTSLNCTLDLWNKKVLQKFDVKIIGVTVQAINAAENRNTFKRLVTDIGLKTPQSCFVKSLEEAESVISACGFPAIIRTSYSLGGKGGGIANNHYEFRELCGEALKVSPIGIIIEKSIIGWKEFELEVMRDASGNSIVICSIENIDPMGVHTGDSITVAPAQTLTDKEYQMMRRASFALMEAVGIISGGCNVQFAVNPENGEMNVIEINPRVSRSSALASKATGYPIAKIATKIALGYSLNELSIDTTGTSIPASFEPTMDYVVTKIPKFNFNKFPELSDCLSTKMKSVGEVMGIGRSFQESLLKAISSGETSFKGLELNSASKKAFDDNKLIERLKKPTPLTLWYISEGLRRGWDIQKLYNITKIDHWFLYKIKELVDLELCLSKHTIDTLTNDLLLTLKEKGFSDAHIAEILKCNELDVRKKRQVQSIHPIYKHIDSTAGEFSSKISYLYSSYDEECELKNDNAENVVILGSGPNRIGQGIEFDYCCVQASKTIKAAGYDSIMINSNPETVSTDYDISSKLFFEPLQLEYVLSVIEKQNPIGVITQFGGYTSISLTRGLSQAGVKILGPSADTIDMAEDRIKFKNILDSIGLKSPVNEIAHSPFEALNKAKRIGFPVIVRPSYIIGGTNVCILSDEKTLDKFFARPNIKFPILLEAFLEDAIELDVDAIGDGENVFVAGILEQLEPAGVHSGDSHSIYPTISFEEAYQKKINSIVIAIGKHLKLRGLFNVQLAIKNGQIYIIEVNPRASRTVPFLSKATNVPLVSIAVDCLLGRPLSQALLEKRDYFINYYYLKVPIFSNESLGINNFSLGPEMKSTGEIMTIGKTAYEVITKAIISNQISAITLKNYLKNLSLIEKPKVDIYKLQSLFTSHTTDQLLPSLMDGTRHPLAFQI